MSGANFWNTKSVTRLGIPGMMLTDGPHGLRKQGGKPDHLGLNKSIPATCEALIEKMGTHLGLGVASEGVSVLLDPGVNIKRSPLCGRNFEYFSEDPLLCGKMAAALIRGIQSNGISACVKHYVANSQELWRMINDSVLDERTLREIYLSAFEIAVKEGGVKCLMTSYNKVNGIYAHEHPHLLREILCGEWELDGVVRFSLFAMTVLRRYWVIRFPMRNGTVTHQSVSTIPSLRANICPVVWAGISIA